MNVRMVADKSVVAVGWLIVTLKLREDVPSIENVNRRLLDVLDGEAEGVSEASDSDAALVTVLVLLKLHDPSPFPLHTVSVIMLVQTLHSW